MSSVLTLVAGLLITWSARGLTNLNLSQPLMATLRKQHDSADEESGNGYCFDGMDNGALNSALDRALLTFRCFSCTASLLNARL